MNYPIWYLPSIGGGTLIALIAIIHVFISHFAVGGGLYLVLAEKKGLREKNQDILDFTKDHARFFLLVTMVLGAMTGVGIWFVIGLVNPAATSFLIHNFVFGWAAEWVFFTVEIVAAFVYFYTFGRMDDATHLKVGYLYLFAAWMSLALINGIIGVMLTPGSWPDGFSFWEGFFNPSFSPSLLFRSAVAVLIAACYGFLSCSFVRNRAVRRQMSRFSAALGLAGLICALPAGLWYVAVLPEPARKLVDGASPTIGAVWPWLTGGLGGLLGLLLLAGILRPQYNGRTLAALVMVCSLLVMGGFEWVREAARRPFVLRDVIYSNGIFLKDEQQLKEEGYLRTALWTAVDDPADSHPKAGFELFVHQCYSCHTVGGLNNDIARRTERMSREAMDGYLARVHEIRSFMPPFIGTAGERQALADYLSGSLHGRQIEATPAGGHPGEKLFGTNCGACHEHEELQIALEGEDQQTIVSMLATLDEISEEMVPFTGSDQEKNQLAEYLGDGTAAFATDSDNRGKVTYEKHCRVCHGVDDLADKTADLGTEQIYTLLGNLNEIQPAMPPFGGSEEERQTLAKFLDGLKKGVE